LIDREGALVPARAIAIAVALAAALEYAHARGVVHRDLKPENVFLQSALAARPDAPKLLDFGISKEADAAPLTLTGAIVGTPLYLAPEQVRGDPVDARTDVYQLGALLFETLSGHAPYVAPSIALLLSSITTRTRADLASRAPHLP